MLLTGLEETRDSLGCRGDHNTLFEDTREHARLGERLHAGGRGVYRGTTSAHPFCAPRPVGARPMVELQKPVNQEPVTGRLAACGAATLLSR